MAGSTSARGPTLLELRTREDARAELLRRRAGRPRQHKQLHPALGAILQDAVRIGYGSSGPLPEALVRSITAGLSATTWNRYLGALRGWHGFASAHGDAFLPADPVRFACFLAEAGERDAGYSQTKIRVCAVRALSELAGTPSPHSHPLVTGYRRGSLRTRGAPRRGSARPIFAHEIPVPAGSPRRRGQPATRGRSIPARSRRARSATARHMAFLHDGALRYDDAVEAQIGDVLHFEDVLDVPVFGSKTDRARAGQPAVLPRSADPASGCAALIQNVRLGMARLLALDPPSLADIATRFEESNDDPCPTGAEALSTWPADVRSQADRLYAAGIAAHRLPIYGRWLFDDLNAGSDLAATLSTQEFVRLSRATLHEAGVDISNVGAHSFRRGRAVGLTHAGAARGVISDMLRHRNPRSAEHYTLASARNVSLALTMRNASHASPARVAAGRGDGLMGRPPAALYGGAAPASRGPGDHPRLPELPLDVVVPHPARLPAPRLPTARAERRRADPRPRGRAAAQRP